MSDLLTTGEVRTRFAAVLLEHLSPLECYLLAVSSAEDICPTCSAKDPRDHPAIGIFGIADICSDPFHDKAPATKDEG